MAKVLSYFLMGLGAVGASVMHFTADAASAASEPLELAQAAPAAEPPATRPMQTPPSSVPIAKPPALPGATPAPAPAPTAAPRPAGAGMSEADKAATLDKVRASLRLPDVVAAKQAVMKQQAPLVFGACPSMTFKSTSLTVLAIPQFDAAGAMRSGAVREVWTGEGCPDRKPVLNIWVYGQPQGTPRVIASFPGTSMADPRLQRDFLTPAMSAAGLAVPECKKFDVVDTRFGAFEGTSPKTMPGRDARMWREDWILRGCDKNVKVVLHFAPDGTGTGGRILSGETQTLTP